MAKNNTTKYLLIGGALYAALYLLKNTKQNKISQEISGTSKIKKSFAAQQVLKLMDKDYTYTSALNTILALYPEIDKKTLEKELNKFI
jgi:hypothetical protein